MARVTITDALGVVETPGTGLEVGSATTHTGPLVGNAAVGSNNIVGTVQCAVGAEVTLATDSQSTVSGAVSVPANSIVLGVALRATATATIGSTTNIGVNVGTAADGSGQQVVANSTSNVASSVTTFWTDGDVISSPGYGALPEAGVGIPLVAGGLYSTSARSLYFKTVTGTGNPTAGKYIPMVYFVRIA